MEEEELHHDSSFTAAPILIVLFLIDDFIQINTFSDLWFPEFCQTLKIRSPIC